MSVKTITLDMEAYSLLYRAKRKGESFSKVVKRRLGTEKTAANLLSNVGKFSLSEDTLNKIEALAKTRKNSVRKPVDLEG